MELGSQAQQMAQEEFKAEQAVKQINNRADIAELEELVAQVGEINTDLEVQMDRANEDKFDEEAGSALEDDSEIDNLAAQDLSGEEAYIKLKIAKIKSRYENPEVADNFHFKLALPLTCADFEKGTLSENDHYLEAYKPILPFARSIAAPIDKYKDWAMVSGFNSKTTERTETVNLYRPVHGVTEGGKGITYYTRPVIATTAGMSTIVNVVMASSCPSNCSFCKEALIARSYAESNIYETSGEITLHWEGKTQSFPAKTKVKFFDPNIQSIVYGPLQVPIGLKYPLADESLRKLFEGTLVRMLAD